MSVVDFIMVNSPYRHSDAVRLLASQIANKKIKSVTIELSKNRRLNLARGDFTSEKIEALSVEWFHIATVLSQLLPDDDFNHCLRSDRCASSTRCEEYLFSSFREQFTTTRGIALDLSAAIDGTIVNQLTREVSNVVPDLYRHFLEEKRVPFGSEIQHRVIGVTTDRGEYNLVFTPFYKVVFDWRNLHVLHSRNGTNTSLKVIHDKSFEPTTGSAKTMLQEHPREHLINDLHIQQTILRLSPNASNRLSACASS